MTDHASLLAARDRVALILSNAWRAEGLTRAQSRNIGFERASNITCWVPGGVDGFPDLWLGVARAILEATTDVYGGAPLPRRCGALVDAVCEELAPLCDFGEDGGDRSVDAGHVLQGADAIAAVEGHS